MSKIVQTIKQNYLPLAILFLFIIFHITLISKTFTFDQEGNMRAAVAGYGDIPFHLTQVSKFAFGDMFDFEEPLYAGEKIRYAFGINYLSGILLRLTGSWSFSMHFPTIVFASFTAIFIFFTYFRVLKNGWAAILALLLFYFGSGNGAWRYINEQLVVQGKSFKDFLAYLVDNSVSTISRWDAVFPQQNIDWGSPISLVLLHQRAFFLGILLFSAVIYLLTKYRNLENRKALIASGILFGLTPLAHYHTFLALGIVLGSIVLYYVWRRNHGLVRRYLLLLSIAAVIATPQIIYLMGGGNDYTVNSFITFRLGWMAEPTIGSIKFPEDPQTSIWSNLGAFMNFLWVNFGLVLPLFILSFILIMKSKQVRSVFRSIDFFAGLGLLFFVFVQLVRVQPWDYDNNKLLVYFQFFAAPTIVALLLWVMAKRRELGRFIFLVAFIAMLYSGIIDNLPRAMVPIEKMPVIFNRDAIRMAYFIRTNVEPHDLILTTSTHLNPVSSLAGRPVLVGYPGWLWTKGVNYSKREHDLRRFFGDPVSNGDVIRAYEARYALIDPSAIYDWKADKDVFAKNFEVVFNSGDFTLYNIQ